MTVCITGGSRFELSSAVKGAINSLFFAGENTNSFIVPPKLINPDPLIIRVQNAITTNLQFHGMSNMMRAGFGELAIRSSKFISTVLFALWIHWSKHGDIVATEL